MDAGRGRWRWLTRARRIETACCRLQWTSSWRGPAPWPTSSGRGGGGRRGGGGGGCGGPAGAGPGDRDPAAEVPSAARRAGAAVHRRVRGPGRGAPCPEVDDAGASGGVVGFRPPAGCTREVAGTAGELGSSVGPVAPVPDRDG